MSQDYEKTVVIDNPPTIREPRDDGERVNSDSNAAGESFDRRPYDPRDTSWLT